MCILDFFTDAYTKMRLPPPPPILYGLLLKKHVLILIRGINGRPGRGVDLEIRTHPDRGGLKIQDFGGRPLQSAPYSTLVFS